jgi:hypothetical protein
MTEPRRFCYCVKCGPVPSIEVHEACSPLGLGGVTRWHELLDDYGLTTGQRHTVVTSAEDYTKALDVIGAARAP